MSQTTLDLLILILIFGVVTLGLDLIVGYARIFSINQALLFGVGAFSYAFCVNSLHTSSLLAAWAIAVPIAATLSAIVAIVSLRVSGDYFLVASFGVQLIGLQVIYNWQDISGGASGVFGLPYPTILGWRPDTLGDYLTLTLVVCVVAYAGVAFLLVSPYGRLVRALGQDEPALGAAGFNPLRLKVGTFILGGSLAAIAGALYGGYNGIAQVSDYSLDVSISLLAMVIVGGAGRIVGGLLGACLLVEIPHLLDHLGVSSTSQGTVKQALFGGLLLAVVFLLPSGVSGTWSKLLNLVRRRIGRPSTAKTVDVGIKVAP
jgi:branched-chain amino acid transport system permease protein